MLGRLKMPISECIKLYRGLSETVFAKNWTHQSAIKFFNAGTGRPWFDANVLKGAVRKLLEERGLDPDAMLKEESDPTCKM
jgi:hypothetical protein